MIKYGTYNEYSSKLFDETEMALVDLMVGRYQDAEFNYNNIYITNKKTYTRILKDLIYLEEIYREKYVRVAFAEDWQSYEKYNKEFNKLYALYEQDLPVLKEKEKQFKDKERAKFIKKIKSLYYYYFVYQMYMDFRFFIDYDWAFGLEKEYFYITDKNDTRYIDLLEECYDEAYESIVLFNETNNNDFLDVEKMEKEIDLLAVDCFSTHRHRGVEYRIYELNYLQPFKYKSKNHTIRIRRATNDIQNRSTYNSIRKKKGKARQNSVIEKFYHLKEKDGKLTAKRFIENEGISESTFYYYKKKYDGEKV